MNELRMNGIYKVSWTKKDCFNIDRFHSMKIYLALLHVRLYKFDGCHQNAKRGCAPKDF